MGRMSSFLISLLLTGLAGSATAAALDASEIRQVRFGGDDGETRIVVEMSSELDFRAFTVSDPSMRLVVDLPRSAWSVAGLETGEGLGYGLVDDFRFFDRSADASRIVFELDGPSVIVNQFGIPANADNPHHRLVVDLRRVEAGQADAASGFPEASDLSQLIAERVEAVYVPPPRERRVIVLDAGHGGHDPGSLGAGGAEEADVTLAAARELQRQLEATGRYVVYMTRNNDTYPSWEERVGVMAEQRADLFLSIHADSSPSAQTRGAAVYTLNDRAENRARQIARRGANHTSRVDVNNILVELELREKRNQSTAFAEVMLQHLEEAGPLLQNPHREANLFVLLDPRVPAVLLEMGFMTNPSDLANMRSERSRSRQMAAVLRAIDAYFARDEVRGSNPVRAAELTPIP
ncbi:MAG: AMIN domain-containing protein [Alphaproteobacteria bacterium]|nr:AMIN domain-containing protein [Alphaproteobacteria bacterium]